MSTFLVVCPSHRDHRELALLGLAREHSFIFHDYASAELEQLVWPAASPADIEEPDREIERILSAYRDAGIDGVLSTDDYPGSALASIVARRMELPGVAPSVNLLCQHKYYARVAQRRVLPGVVPEFALFDPRRRCEARRFPVFIKPVKSFFSVGAGRVDTAECFAEQLARATLPEPFFQPFRTLFERYVERPFGDGRVMVEELLEGHQATVEGYAFRGEIHTIGIVDAVLYPGTVSFSEFRYPSCLPPAIQKRMAEAAATVMKGIGFDHGLFNVEFMYDSERDKLHIIEINPRMASQFADLYEKVDGYNTYSALLDLALGRPPRPVSRQGKHAMAVSHVLRRFRDGRALTVPSRQDLEQLQQWQPDIRAEVFATQGGRLSCELQDGQSYRYGILNIGGRDRQEVLEIIAACRRRLPFVFSED